MYPATKVAIYTTATVSEPGKSHHAISMIERIDCGGVTIEASLKLASARRSSETQSSLNLSSSFNAIFVIMSSGMKGRSLADGVGIFTYLRAW
jgi:hypothetical protein